jgi:hypothetical protein
MIETVIFGGVSHAYSRFLLVAVALGAVSLISYINAVLKRGRHIVFPRAMGLGLVALIAIVASIVGMVIVLILGFLEALVLCALETLITDFRLCFRLSTTQPALDDSSVGECSNRYERQALAPTQTEPGAKLNRKRCFSARKTRQWDADMSPQRHNPSR